MKLTLTLTLSISDVSQLVTTELTSARTLVVLDIRVDGWKGPWKGPWKGYHKVKNAHKISFVVQD